MNPGPPGPCLIDRIPPVERREPTLVRDVDLREPLPDLPGGAVTRAWLFLRVGGVAVGRLLIAVPERGLSGADVGAAVASRLGTIRHAPTPMRDAQARSRSRGRMSRE